MPDSLRPMLRDRLRRLVSAPGWPRALALRRVVAAVLVLLAAALAVRPPPQARAEPTVPMLVAARDLPPGSSLRAGDVRVVRAPESLRPPAALTAAEQVTGRVLAGAATRGEPVTRARLVGRENSHLSTGDPDAVAVPVRLADPEVAALLAPGARVDVVTVASEDGSAPVLLAANATVVTVRADDPTPRAGSRPGRLVVIAVPRESATRLASVSLGRPVAVTMR
ncbi:Flp pilus assembly protein CpaB [Actinophytocola sp.]|uniref:Flp pilus assembly protein CpaB n=1 Tax=Actinophytocola sp. TaxID=1872138 RepID=UPI0025BAD832|nr:Flp pilus assembly protein CpaB [Actinophytocola sp.]